MELSSTGTLLSSSTMLGRLYGQEDTDECWFDIVCNAFGQPFIQVRVIKPGNDVMRLPCGSHVLVQLFEQPDILWLAHATIINEMPIICYAAVEMPESADGRTTPPKLAEVPLEKINEAVNDAMHTREQR